MRDEPLRTARILAGQSHADCTAIANRFVYLATNLIARPAVAVAARVAALNNEVRHDAMKVRGQKKTRRASGQNQPSAAHPAEEFDTGFPLSVTTTARTTLSRARRV
jgi:hypothetical protein